MRACMRSRRLARAQLMHALMTALPRMHALTTASHPSPQVRELLISQGVLECSSGTTRVLTTRTTRDELFLEVRAALMSPDDEP